MAGEIEGNVSEWENNDISKVEADPVPIIDPGVGQAAVLRHFFFRSQPVPKGTPKPTKLQIVSQFKHLIEMSLWGDGLMIQEHRPLEVHTLSSVKKVSRALWAKMKEEGSDFVILCLAEPRSGQMVQDYVHKVGQA